MITIKLLDEKYADILSDSTNYLKLCNKIDKLESDEKIPFTWFIPIPHLDYLLMQCKCKEEELPKYMKIIGIKKWQLWEKPENEKEEFESFLDRNFNN